MTEQATYRKEVESHSSALTNQRIFNIKEVVWKVGYEVMGGKPNPYSRLQYAAAVMQFYIEVKDMCESDDLALINKQMIELNKASALMRITLSPKHMENMLQHTLAVQSMLNSALQKKGYFFRMGRRDPKGIDAALEIFGNNVWEDRDARTLQKEAGE